jgi:hypothetical protein
MKVFLLKTVYYFYDNTSGFIFKVVSEKELNFLIKSLPWYCIEAQKELTEFPSIQKDKIIKNFKDLFYGQPEIIHKKIEGLDWYIYADFVKEIFLDKKSLQDQLIDANPCYDQDYGMSSALIIKLSVMGNDNSGSLKNNIVNNKLSKFRTILSNLTEVLEKDWRYIYHNEPLLKFICPDYNEFLNAVINIYGYINLKINEDKSIEEYIPNPDRLYLKEVCELKEYIDKNQGKTYVDKMKRICRILLDKSKGVTVHDITWLPTTLKEPIMVLGPERVRALGYQRSILYEEIENRTKENIIRDKIIGRFRVGEKYLRRDIKKYLDTIFKEVKYKKTPVSTYILNIFDVIPCKLTDLDGKESRGYIIKSIKKP